jgi:hypothetical protein
MAESVLSKLSDEERAAYDRMDSKTKALIRADLEEGRQVANLGTFRVADDDGHVEHIDPVGKPGTANPDVEQ